MLQEHIVFGTETRVINCVHLLTSGAVLSDTLKKSQRGHVRSVLAMQSHTCKIHHGGHPLQLKQHVPSDYALYGTVATAWYAADTYTSVWHFNADFNVTMSSCFISSN